MKFKLFPTSNKMRGICFICGKSTNLNIHTDCSLIVDKRRKQVINGEKQSRDSLERKARRRAKNNYKNGGLPGLSRKDLET